MPVFNPRKTVSPVQIDCKGSASVKLEFSASAHLAEDPADIILIMDRSSSMDARKMELAKSGANDLIQMVAGAQTGDINANTGESRLGIVSFASSAVEVASLTNDREILSKAISNLAAGGQTNHSLAFKAAESALGPKTQNRQVAVMFTDGITTLGGDASNITDRMKANGIEIYCIGILDSPELLNSWASEPLSEHVASSNDKEKIVELFKKVASQIVISGAQDVVIKETVSNDFKITKLNAPSFGTAEIIGEREIVWNMDYAGDNLNPQSYSLTFDITHIGDTGGEKAFNSSVIYSDREKNQLVFPSPKIKVKCQSGTIYPEPCPVPTQIIVPGCKDSVHVSLNNAALSSLGRIIQLDLTLKSICPNKRVAASVILYELDSEGNKYNRGIKHFLIPAHGGASCQDITLKCINFSVPEALDVSENTTSICNARKFEALVIANYVDTDFSCCKS